MLHSTHSLPHLHAATSSTSGRQHAQHNAAASPTAYRGHGCASSPVRAHRHNDGDSSPGGLYERALAQQRRLTEMREAALRMRAEEEMSRCTFWPVINETAEMRRERLRRERAEAVAAARTAAQQARGTMAGWQAAPVEPLARLPLYERGMRTRRRLEEEMQRIRSEREEQEVRRAPSAHTS